MSEAFLLALAKSLTLNLTSYAKEQLSSAWGLDSEIKKLERTMEAINAVLIDAEQIPGGALGHFDQDWLTKLQNALYDASDVFDLIMIRAERKRLMVGNAFGKEVKLFFSSSNQLSTSISLAQRVKSIRKYLDEISKDRRDFGNTSRQVEVVVQEERENLSDNVVGRDTEKNDIINMLLDSSFKDNNVCVIPIVGNGGLGKSTLARHVFNSQQVRENFKDLYLWVPLPQDITLRGVMEKILAAAGENPKDCALEQLKIRLSGLINGKKYILVLDNVWIENVTDWRDLETVLTPGAAHGSRILFTTRDPTIAKNMGTIASYELQPLKDNNSWSLLESIVFGKKGCHDSNLKEIGLKILPMCYNVPLAIRNLAGVLANDISVNSWSRFQGDTVSNLGLHGQCYDIMPVLRLSYDHLSPSMLKSCFSYCSLFPNGYVFDKNNLISLWIAQDFVEPLHRGQSLEEAGAEYVDKLLNKGLLQRVLNDDSHKTCKLHDLMYDLTYVVARLQCKMLSSSEDDDFGRDIRHISIGCKVDSSWKLPLCLQSYKQLRTFLWVEKPAFQTRISRLLCKDLMTSFLCLRVLDLHGLAIEELSESLGKLIHLRYLDISDNDFVRLPKSITLLHNLQYLNLQYCWNLIGFPKDMKKLMNLRHLKIKSNWSSLKLPYFPSGLRNLTKLMTLSEFAVGLADKCTLGNKSNYARLSDLQCLDNLRGELTIFIQGYYQKMGLDAKEANLKGKKNLKCLRLIWLQHHLDEDELVLENLEPHRQISELSIRNYGGTKQPTWMTNNKLMSSLLHLAAVKIEDCANIKHIPSFSQLPNLKSIHLKGLTDVEYLESSPEECEGLFFPSLSTIKIRKLPNLKGWRERGAENLSFPCVSEAYVIACEKLLSMPSFPNVVTLTLRGVENLHISIGDSATSSSSSSLASKLEILEIDSVNHLISLPRKCVLKVSQLTFAQPNNYLLEVSDLRKGLEGMSSLKSLVLKDCVGLTSFSGLPTHLSTVEKLELSQCCNIPFLSDTDQSEKAWRVLKNLRFLRITGIFDLEFLPEGIQHLTKLQSLELQLCEDLVAIPDWIGKLCSLSRLDIINCPKLTSLPKDMSKLTKLKLLLVENCPELQRRCQRYTGEDWHKIQHVKEFFIR